MSVFCCAFLRLWPAFGQIWCSSDRGWAALLSGVITHRGGRGQSSKIFGMEKDKYLIIFLWNQSSQENDYKSKSKALSRYQKRGIRLIILTEQITCKWVIHNCFIKIVNKRCLILYLIKHVYNFSQKNLSCEHKVVGIRLSKNSTLWKIWIPQPKMSLEDAVLFQNISAAGRFASVPGKSLCLWF